MAGFPCGWGGAPHHGRGGQQLATPGPAHRPHPLVLPPEEPAAGAAPAPTQAAAHVTAKPGSNGPKPSRPRPGPQAKDTGGRERTNGAWHPPGGPGLPTLSAPPLPPPSAQREDKRRRRSGGQLRPQARDHARQRSLTDPQTADHLPLTRTAAHSARRPPPIPPRRCHATRRRQREERGGRG